MDSLSFRIRSLLVLVFLAGPLLADMNSAEDRRNFADGLMSRRLFARAATEYEALLRDFPDIDGRDSALFRWGEALRSLQRDDEADAVFARLLAECPQSEYRFHALFKRGTIAQKAERYADAVGFFRQMLEADSGGTSREDALYYLGESLSRDGRPEESIPQFEAFLKEFPASAYAPYAKLSLALALDRRAGKEKNADSERAHTLLREVAAGNVGETPAEALYLIGESDYSRGDYAGASEAFGELRRRFPGSRQTSEAATRAAWASERLGRPEATLALADEALAKTDVPHRDEWLYLKGRALFHLGRHEESADAMLSVANDFDSSAFKVAAVFEGAIAYERAKRYADALMLLGIIPKNHELRPQVLRHSGVCAEALGRTADAIGFYTDLDASYPNGADAEDILYRLAHLCREEKRWKDAATHYAAFAKRFPKSKNAAAALFAAGSCRKEAGELEPALECWRALVRDYPQDEFAPETCYLLGTEEYRRNHLQDALTHFEACIKYGDAAKEHLPDAHFWKGYLLLQLERLPESVEALRTAETTAPTQEKKDRARLSLWAVLQRLDRRDEAADVLSLLLDSPDAQKWLKPQQVAWALEHQYFRGRLDEAAKIARFLTRTGEGDEWLQTAWYWVGRIERDRKDPAAAEAAFRRAADLPVETRYVAESFLRIGEYRYAAKDFEAAERRFQRAQELSMAKELESVRVQAAIGQARSWLELGRKEEAARQLLGICMYYQSPELIPPLIEETIPLLRELGQNAEADMLLSDLAQMREAAKPEAAPETPPEAAPETAP